MQAQIQHSARNQNTPQQGTPEMKFTNAQLRKMTEPSLLKFALAYLSYLNPCINEVDEMNRITGISVSAINQYKRGGEIGRAHV